MQFPTMELDRAYYYTATIIKWYHLLKSDKYKDIIIESLQYLVASDKIRVHAFVIMPNHIHLAWRLLSMNGKEMPHSSFMKYTAHCFLADLQQSHPQILPYFQVNNSDRQYHFWQRNSLPIILYNDAVWQQKINYIHNNPIKEKWQLASLPHEYKYSSAKFYEYGIDDFGILTHWRD
jgi:putative transposase